MPDIIEASPAPPPGRPQPSRSVLVGWLRLNLALTLAIGGFVSTGAGMLIEGTWHIAFATRDLAELQAKVADQATQLVQFHGNMVDVDRRFNDLISTIQDLRRNRDAQVATDEQKIAVLQAQLQFFADRVGSSPPKASR